MTRTVKDGSAASSGAASHAESSSASVRINGRNATRRQVEMLQAMGQIPFQNSCAHHYSTMQKRNASVHRKRNAKNSRMGARKSPARQTGTPGKTLENHPRAACTYARAKAVHLPHSSRSIHS